MRKYNGTPYKIRLPNCLQHQTFMKLNYSLLKMRNLSASNKMNTLQIRQRMVNADFYFLHLFPHAVKMYINIFIMYIDCRYFRIEIIKLDMKTALLKKSTQHKCHYMYFHINKCSIDARTLGISFPRD